MNRSTDTRNSSGKLPSFLGEDANAGAQSSAASGSIENEFAELDDTDLHDPATEDGYGDDEYGESDAIDDVEEDEEDDDDEVDEEPTAYHASTPQRSARRGTTPKDVHPAGGIGLVIGAAVTVAGLLAAALPAATAAMAAFIAPQTVTLLGLAVFALAASRRHASRVQQSVTAMATQRDQTDDELRDMLAQILQGQQNQQLNHSGSEIADVQHVMLSLQRQDQKINNLTKAIKMYGKPLMEIAGQGTELAGSVAQVKTLIEGAAESTRQAINRVEQLLRSSSKNDLGDLPEQVGKLHVSLAAMSQRLEDSEVRKSLLRVEDTTSHLRSQLDALQRGDHVKAATAELQLSLDKATAGLSKGIEQLREGNLSGLETSVRDIQRELSGLATGMSQIQAAVKNGARTAAAATQTATPTAAPASAASNAAPPSPVASKAGSPSPAGAAAANDDTDADGYATGKRKTTGKNVLGAIAKLKQMKG